ncbi:MAG: alpha-galactosidase [Prolixibacteraceae bacterium]|jgi:alpha-galactosidase|nr:alpha-galactosidase [Prolixibacteraceae bacterium]
MKRIAIFSFFLTIILSVHSEAQDPVQNGSYIKIGNDRIERLISYENGKITTLILQLKDYPLNFVSIEKEEPKEYKQLDIGSNGEFRIWRGPNPDEFSFLLNGKQITGKTGWGLAGTEPVTEAQGSGYCISLKGSQEVNRDIFLQLSYITYPGLPVLRKKIVFINRGNSEICLENIDTECLSVAWGNTHNVVYQNYGRFKHLGPYIGDWDDPAIILHDQTMNRGMVLGNEAPGVTKRTTSCLDGRNLTIGLTHLDQDYPARVWLSPGEKWESPWTFIALYKNDNPREIIDGPVSEFVREHIGIRLAQIPQRPTFVYNTWSPFRRNINDKLIRELADAAAGCGVQEFVIDDGWQVGFGDWEIDYKKFPDGLKPVFDYIKSKGMKPGLWLSMGAASVNSKVYQEHPEWFIEYKDGETIDLHGRSKDRRTACFTTGWTDYIKDKILGLVREHGLEYVKLDFAIATSAYIFDRSVSGCYAKDHSHKDREESFLEIYRAAWKLFDDLHAEAPNLFIDCTYETMGALQLIDYDMCKHAEGNWLSNFEEPAPTGSLRVRQMAWWRSPVIPATALVIGNQSLDDENAMYSFQSLAGSLPIMLGDPRKLSTEKQNEIRGMANWLSDMEKRHNIMLYRQDMPGFGEPSNGQWDGFQRINTQTKSGGIVGVFRQNAMETERIVTVKMLDPQQIYEVKEAVTGSTVAQLNGKELQTNGFSVNLKNEHDAALFEISVKK